MSDDGIGFINKSFVGFEDRDFAKRVFFKEVFFSESLKKKLAKNQKESFYLIV
jgi:hypothetical protein